MADQRADAEGITVVALQEVGPLTALDPVVAGIAEYGVEAGAGVHEIVAQAREAFGIANPAEDDIGSITTEEQVEAAGIHDHVIAIAALEVVVTEGVGDHVIAGAAEDEVVAATPFEGVVALITMDGVVPFAGGEPVVGGGAPEHHMFDAAVADRAIGQAGEQGRFVVGREGIIQNCSGGAHPTGFKEEGRRGKHIARQMHGRGVAAHDVAEALLLQLGEDVQAGGAGKVVEAVVVLQAQHLRAEHVGEGGAEHAAEGLQLLRQAADPEVHILQPAQGAAGVDAGGVEEVLGVEVSG